MAFREIHQPAFWPHPHTGSCRAYQQLNASMDEFIRLLHTNGYDSKSSASAFGAMAGHRNGHHANRTLNLEKRKECKSFLSNRRQPDRRLQAGTSPPADGRLGFEKQEIYNGKGGHN